MSVENEKLVFINTPPKFEIDLALGYWPPKSEAEKFSYLLFLLLLSKREKNERIAAQRSGGEEEKGHDLQVLYNAHVGKLTCVPPPPSSLIE